MRPLRRHVYALAGYLALITFFHWPVVRDLRTRVLSDGADGASFLWSYWAIPRAVGRLENPFHTAMLFHPVGTPLSFSTTAPLEALLVWPMAQVIGRTAAVNVMLLGAVLLAGMGAYLLALHQCGSRRAAFLAGAAFAFLPWYHGRILAHHNLMHIWILPFGLLALLLLYESATRKRAVALGVIVAVAFFSDLTLTLFLLFAAALIAAWRWRETIRREIMVRLAQAAGLATLLCLPLLIAMARTLRAGELDPLRGWGGADAASTDLLSWVVPGAYHRFWGRAFAPLSLEVSSGERLAYPGLVMLILALVGVVVALRRRRGFWVLVFVAFFVLSLGPFLHANGVVGDRFEVFGRRFSVPLPYMAVRAVPVFNALRIPGRFVIGAALAIDVLAAVALAALIRRRPRLAWAVTAGALAILVIEFLPVPYRLPIDRAPQAYAAVKSHPDDAAVLELPLQWRDGFGLIGDQLSARDNTIFLDYASRHGKALTGGMVARYPNKRRAVLTSLPVYRQVLSMQGDPGFPDPPTFTATDLRALRIGFVVYHRDRPVPAALEYFTRMGLPVLADDGTVLVWKVP